MSRAGRPRKTPGSLAADKANSNGPCHDHPRRHSIRHTIPEKTGSQAARPREDSPVAALVIWLHT